MIVLGGLLGTKHARSAAWLTTGDGHRSVAIGMGATARVITTAGLIMIVVFASFVINPHLRFPIVRRRPEPVESAPRRLAAMAYGHSRLNPAESCWSMQLSGMRQVRRESLTVLVVASPADSLVTRV